MELSSARLGWIRLAPFGYMGIDWWENPHDLCRFSHQKTPMRKVQLYLSQHQPKSQNHVCITKKAHFQSPVKLKVSLKVSGREKRVSWCSWRFDLFLFVVFTQARCVSTVLHVKLGFHTLETRSPRHYKPSSLSPDAGSLLCFKHHAGPASGYRNVERCVGHRATGTALRWTAMTPACSQAWSHLFEYFNQNYLCIWVTFLTAREGREKKWVVMCAYDLCCWGGFCSWSNWN
jgi:hypothetical protein